MKCFGKAIVGLFACVCGMALLGVSAYADSSIDICTVDADKVGSEVSVVIKAVDCGKLSSGTLYITYDNTKLKPVSYKAGDLGNCISTGKLDYADNKCSFVFAGTDNIQTEDSDSLVTFVFEGVDSGAASVALDSNSILSDSKLKVITYTATGHKLAYVGVYAGDVDKNGTLLASDAAAVLQYTLDPGFDVSGKYDFTGADFNKDGKVTSNDAAHILQATLGVE